MTTDIDTPLIHPPTHIKDGPSLDQAVAAAKCLKANGNVEGCIELYRRILGMSPLGDLESNFLLDIQSTIEDEKLRKAVEAGIFDLARVLAEHSRIVDFQELFHDLRKLFVLFPKARTAKIVRSLLDIVSSIPDSFDVQEELCKKCIDWCNTEKRTFLKHRVETRLVMLYYKQSKYSQGMSCLGSLLKEAQKLDDKLLLLEIHLISSKLYFAVQNIAKSKAALTTCRTNANAIHCPPLLQAEIDLQAGVLHAEEEDYMTAYSYFYEALEAFRACNDIRAAKTLKYQMMMKILSDKPNEALSLACGKNVLCYYGADIESLKVIAKCRQKRSLKEFEEALVTYKKELGDDWIIERHIKHLHETLLEQNILRLIEAYSRVEINHLAKLMESTPIDVESKLCQMILDCKLDGTVDQGAGELIVVRAPAAFEIYNDAIATFKNLSEAVEVLHLKAHTVS